MKLNLTSLIDSDIKYTIVKFPDGQQSVNIEGDISGDIEVISRLNNWEDLELIICATRILQNHKVNNISLIVPYFIGARSDRSFEPKGVHYIKQVIAPVINMLNFTSVKVLDPHSDVLEACIDNLDILSIDKFYQFVADTENHHILKYYTVVAPDSGAYKRAFKFASKFDLDIITCNKIRTKDGKIIKTEVPDLKYKDNFIIIDDICDGGMTFVEVAKAIREQKPKCIITLVVSHNLFSKGIPLEGIDKIYSTNSYQDSPLINNQIYYKQFNIFKNV